MMQKTCPIRPYILKVQHSAKIHTTKYSSNFQQIVVKGLKSMLQVGFFFFFLCFFFFFFFLFFYLKQNFCPQKLDVISL